ncbi:MAG: ATP-binding protein [bacterium]
MQRRLFSLFLLLSLLPTALVLLVNWEMSRRHLGYLDSRGLQDSFESSLDLARQILDRELASTQETAALVAGAIETAVATHGDLPAAILPTPPEGTGYRFTMSGGEHRYGGVVNEELFEFVARQHPDLPQAAARITTADGDWLAAAEDFAAGRLILLRHFDGQLASRLDAVASGSSRVRQLRLYYGALLRGGTLVSIIALGLVLLALSLYLSRRLSRQIARPIQALVEATKKVASGNLDHQVTVTAPDELADLIDTFNRMTRDLKTSKEELVRAERAAAWQGVARRLAHEIKNPLTPITLAMHRIRKRSDDPAVADAIDMVLEESGNLERLAEEFSLYARLPEPIREPVDLEALVRGVVDLYTDPDRITVSWEGWAETVRIQADPGLLRQVFANLVKNAVTAMDGPGRLRLQREQTADRVLVRITDSGGGLPEPPEQVFEPYFTTRDAGTGLGLAIARKIVEDHGGTLTAGNVAEGAVLEVSLPRDVGLDSA